MDSLRGILTESAQTQERPARQLDHPSVSFSDSDKDKRQPGTTLRFGGHNIQYTMVGPWVHVHEVRATSTVSSLRSPPLARFGHVAAIGITSRVAITTTPRT